MCLRAVSLKGLVNELRLPNKPREAGVEHKEGACQSSDEACSAWIHNFFLFQACFVNIQVVNFKQQIKIITII